MSSPDARILIVRLSAIGDVVHGLPVLNVLRDKWPRAFVAWAIESRAADLLRGHRALDELIVLERGWYRSWARLREVRRRLRQYHFDTAIDLQGLTKSAGVAWLSGAPRRIGYGDQDGRELSRWFNTELVKPKSIHVVDRNLELLRPLGIETASIRLELDVAATNSEMAIRTLESLHMRGGFAMINPGAGWRSKLWPPDRFAAVARHLGSSRGMRSLVVWADDQELVWAQQIVEGSRGYATLAPATSLGELAAIAQRATLFVSSDTGPLHIAAAVRTPCVGLFGPMPGERNGAYGPEHVTVQKMLLHGSSRQRRNAGPESMLAIEVADVTAACDEILDRAALARRSA
jgi:heptosyltransferase I